MLTRPFGVASLAFALTGSLTQLASAQVTATCQLNVQENRVHSFVPLEGTLKSTEQMLSPDLPFMQYLPNGHDPTKKWPVIIFLHGIGEVGGNLRKVTEHSLPRVVESPEQPQSVAAVYSSLRPDVTNVPGATRIEINGQEIWRA